MPQNYDNVIFNSEDDQFGTEPKILSKHCLLEAFLDDKSVDLQIFLNMPRVFEGKDASLWIA